MEHSNAALVRHLYDARARNDLDAVRSMLPAEIAWHEPEAVLEMIWGAQHLTGGTFRLACAARSSSTGSTPWR